MTKEQAAMLKASELLTQGAGDCEHAMPMEELQRIQEAGACDSADAALHASLEIWARESAGSAGALTGTALLVARLVEARGDSVRLAAMLAEVEAQGIAPTLHEAAKLAREEAARVHEHRDKHTQILRAAAKEVAAAKGSKLN